MAISAAGFHQALKKLLPTGRAWPQDNEAVMNRLLAGLAEEPARVMHKAEQLRRELIPSQAQELLPVLEESLGLSPDGKSVSARQDSVSQQLRAIGTLNPEYYVSIARELGYTIRIVEHKPARAGQMRAGDIVGGIVWAYAATVHAPEATVRHLTAGGSTGDALGSWGNQLLEQGVSRYWPAHIVLTFAYGEEVPQ